jgi:hypothetical protein
MTKQEKIILQKRKTNMKIENLNTQMIKMFGGTYDSLWIVDECDDEGNEIDTLYEQKDIMISILGTYQARAKRIVKDMGLDFIKELEFTNSFSPREYNFANDQLDFDMEVDEDKMLRALDILENDKEFNEFLKAKYTSYDGFLSFTPNNYNELRDQIYNEGDEYYQAISAMINYLVGEEKLEEIEVDACEQWRSDGYNGLDFEEVEN